MRRIIPILVLLLATATFVVVAAGGADQPPEPAFTSDTDAPTTFGVDGPDGQPVICANGKELRVPKSKVLGKPTLTPTAAAKQALLSPKRSEEQFWRCGTGANPHLSPRLVPASEDPLNAPAEATP